MILHLLNTLMSKDRDGFSNDTSFLVKYDVVMVKSGVKTMSATIFSEPQVNYSKFRYEYIKV